MSNSLDSFLTRIGDVTIERVTPRGSPGSSDQGAEQGDLPPDTAINDLPSQTVNDDSSELSSGESADGERGKKNDTSQPDEIEEVRSEGSGDDMDLDETIDTQIGVRMESERQQSESSSPEDDTEPVNILDTLPLEGAPIEGQEVTEADLLGQPLKDDDNESIDNDKSESMSGGEEDVDGHKRRVDPENPESTKKKQKKDDGNDDSASECETKAEKKLANMRRNIREVMDETQLDEATLSAQRQEMERLRRVQEQQRIIREVQRQIAINRQNNKTQTRVISLLQGKQNQGDTTISESTSSTSSSQVRLPSSVMLKVNAGSGVGSQTSTGAQGGQMPRRPMEGMRWQKGRGGGQPGAQTSISRVPNRSTSQNTLQQRIRMMTPSVSISPVVPKKEPLERSEYFSDSEMSDIEGEEALHEKQLHTMRKVSGAPKSQKPAKGKDVVTISSSSESSDDDCIVLSDPSGGEETDNEDDPSNSGMHTNDRYNLPDEHGRVLINVGHPETEPDVYLAPQVARIIKPHQIGGIRFLFDNIVESIERYKNSSGFGCILAHSMGLGKTLQVASFCDIFFRCTTAKTVLCIMPINTLQNWLAEFNMWLPYEDPSSDTSNQKNAGGNSVKTELIADTKQEIKDEVGSQSDMSNMSRPISTESAHRLGPEGVQQHQQQQQHPQQQQQQSQQQQQQQHQQQSQQQQPQTHMMNENNPYGHQSYGDQGMMAQYGQDGMMNKTGIDQSMQMHQNYHGGMPQNSVYGTSAATAYDPMKADIHCHSMGNRPLAPGTNYGLNNQLPGGGMYSGIDPTRPGQGQMFPELDSRNSSGQMYPGMNNSHAPTSMYPGYENPSQTYGTYPPPTMQQMEHAVKKEDGPLSQNSEINIKIEPEDGMKKEERGSSAKDESSEEKKSAEIIETPFNVDAPIGCELRPRHFRLHILNDSHKTMAARARVILDWQKNGGVLLIGYELYRQLSLKKSNKAKRKRNQPFKDTVDVEEEDKNKGLLDEMHGALVSPGPDLVICDEGHRIKNSHASISMALKQMKTKRRIVLTGYPLQNNLLEYWCMVDFVRPNYLGTKSEFCNMFERPIQNGQCIDSTPQDIRLMRYRAHVLHALLEGFVQRRSHSVLQISLPRKEEYILLVRMTPHQRKLYDIFMNQVVKTRAVPNPLKAFAVCCKIWNHPDILYHFLRKRQANEEDDLDLEETIGEKPAPGAKRTKGRQPKGEPKKGKKVNAAANKNKPAASVPPTSSSSSSNDNVEGENAAKPGQFGNFSPQISNANYQNPGQPQQQQQQPLPPPPPPQQQQQQANYSQGYQNYRPSEQNNYYRNEGSHGTYNEFYNNQGQPRYGSQSQSFQSYSQAAPGYNASQNYNQNQQQQNYMGNNDKSGNPRFTSPPSNSDFRPESANGNYESPGMFPRPYGFQEPGRNYPPNMNQGTHNYPQSGGPQTSTFPSSSSTTQQGSNVPVNDYGGYGANQPQNYPPTAETNNQMYPRSENHQSMQNPSLGYQQNQQNQNSNGQPQSSNYMTNQSQNPPPAGNNQSRGFSPSQSNQNAMMQNHSYSSTQQGQNTPHGYQSNQGNPGGPSQTSGHGYPANQPTPNSLAHNHPQGYIGNAQGQAPVGQNQIRGYSGGSQNQNAGGQNQSSYPSNQSSSGSLPQTQTHGYSADRQGQTPPTQGSIHGYPGNRLGPPAPQQNTSYSQNQQNQGPSSGNYSSNQQQQAAAPGSQGQSHRYGSSQQAQVSGMPQNQAMTGSGYPTTQQSQGSGMNPSEQMYPRGEGTARNYSGTPGPQHEYSVDRQGRNPTPNSSANYMANQQGGSQSQNSMPGNYTTEGNNQNQAGQFNKESEDPYWQRNYAQQGRQDQCNDQYFREPSTNRYQNNYYQGQNYGNSGTYDGYGGVQNADDGKNSQGSMMPRPGQGTYDKSGKETTANVGAQGQTLAQNNAPTGTGGYSSNEGQCTNMPRPLQSVGGCAGTNTRMGQVDPMKEDDKEKEDVMEKDKEDKSDDEILAKDEEKDSKNSPSLKEEPGIPYDWATELMKGYVPGLIDASAKMRLFFCILEEAVRLGDRVLAFSQSLFTLNLIEDFLARNNLKHTDGQSESWGKNINYYRLDGSTSALEREKLINEFNCNPKIHLFLVSTRAGSLGINLVGANRAIVFDASWNPCHDTQAVCRVYRYGQCKPCFVYRLVTDNCLERKIYDRQISKQGMADRVVDQCNPDAHLSLKEATTLSWDWEEDSQIQDFSQSKDTYTDEVMHCVLERHSSLLTKQPFHHESLLVDRKDKKLSQAEKRLARRGYELEKMAANCSRPSYSYVPGNTATRAGGLQIRAIRGGDAGTTQKPVASVRPMQQRGAENLGQRGIVGSRWIPAEVWQRQGMSAQEMTLPLDVVIPTNSPDKGSIVLKAGQRVMVLKSPKGIYMQLESGKIIAIRTALKLNQQKRDEEPKKGVSSVTPRVSKPEVSFPLRNNSAISIIPKATSVTSPGGTRPLSRPGSGPGYRPFGEKEPAKRGKPVATGAAKPQVSQVSLTNQVSLQRVAKAKQDQLDHSSMGENSNSSDSQMRSDQRVEEVRLEDVVGEASSNPEYSPSNSNRDSNNDGDNSLQKHTDDKSQEYVNDHHISAGQGVTSQHEAIASEISSKLETHGSQTEGTELSKPSEQLMNYGQSYGGQGEKPDSRSDEIIIEESSATKLAPTAPGPRMQIAQPSQSQLHQPQPLQPHAHRTTEMTKNNAEPSNSAAVPPSGGTNAVSAKEREARVQDIPQGDPHGLAQGYPYAQYPRYYDYADPRSRSLPSPYGTYFPGVTPHPTNPRLAADAAKSQPDVAKPAEDRAMMSVPAAYSQSPTTVPKAPVESNESKATEIAGSTLTTTTTNPSRDDPHIPTAFTHPANSRYPGPYPPTPYDPYSQHYPPAPGSSAAYPPSGAPGYAAYGGPTYNTDYARMYSAFHGPPPAADPYMHRGYAPPSTHPTNYYPPFPHPPPPPYPNYSFLPPYPNPNMPGEPQPPAQ